MDGFSVTTSPAALPLSVSPSKQSDAAPDGPEDAEALRKAAQEFEAQFIHMMLRAMRETVPEDPLLGDSQSDFFRDQMDLKMAQEMSRSPGFGLADAMVQQLSRVAQEDAETGSTAALSVERLSVMQRALRNDTQDAQWNALKFSPERPMYP